MFWVRRLESATKASITSALPATVTAMSRAMSAPSAAVPAAAKRPAAAEPFSAPPLSMAPAAPSLRRPGLCPSPPRPLPPPAPAPSTLGYPLEQPPNPPEHA